MAITPMFAPPGSALAKQEQAARQARAQAAAAAVTATGGGQAQAGAAAPTLSVRERLSGMRMHFDDAARAGRALDELAARAPAVISQAAMASRTGVAFDEHQQEMIRANERIVIGRAMAGSGKTTTSIGFADVRPRASFIYMCFGAENAREAQIRFGGKSSHVKCRTTHSLAYAAGGHRFEGRILKKGGWRPRDIAAQLGLEIRVAACVGKALSSFYSSTASTIGEQHLGAAVDWGLSPAEQDQVIDASRRAWKEMQVTGGTMPLVHDSYLKMWALTRPVLRYDYMILDEAQDTNPLTEAIVMDQLAHMKLLAIGDPHQSIFAFRGATNAMENLSELDDARIVSMPRTWRFGPITADICNKVLQNLKGETVSIVGMGTDGPLTRRSTLLTRTNAGLFDQAVSRRGEGMHWIGSVDNYGLDTIRDAYSLWTDRRYDIQDPYMKRFGSWGDLVDYAEKARDAEARTLIKVVEAHTHEVPRLVTAIKANAVEDPTQAELTLTTLHKSKGMEWDCVKLGEDIKILFDAEKEICEFGELSTESAQEINLLYVGLSRAKKRVSINSETGQWLKALPSLQDERLRALGGGRPGQANSREIHRG